MRDDRNAEVAETIRQQLGGRTFTVMTGARNFTYDGPALTFGLPARFARNDINRVTIRLEPSDTYTVTFWKVGRAPGFKTEVVSKHEDVYAEDLRGLFSEETGLHLTAPTVYRVAQVRQGQSDQGLPPSRLSR